MQDDDVWGTLKDLQSLDFPEGRLVVVNFFEGDGEVIGETTASVDVGVSSRSDPLQNLVFGDDLSSGMDAPALGWRVLVHVRIQSVRTCEVSGCFPLNLSTAELQRHKTELLLAFLSVVL